VNALRAGHPRAAARASLLALALSACGDGREPAPASDAAPRVDVASLDAATVAQRLLAACHGEVRGFDRFAAHVTLPDGNKAKAFGSLPQRVRIEWPDGRVHLVDGERAFAPARDGAAAQQLDEADATRAFAMRRMLDAATLGPVRRAVACERTGTQAFELAQPDGSRWRVDLQPDALLVASLAEQRNGSAFEVKVLGHLRTTTTRIVNAADTAPLGACAIRFDAVDFAWDESMFEDASTPSAEAPAQQPTFTVGAPQHPAEPTIESVRPARWLLVADPGTWQGRAAAVARWTAELKANGQSAAGFAGVLLEDGTARLVVPFRQGKDAKTFAAPAEAFVREAPATRALAVYPPSGDFAERATKGAQQLREALAARGLTADGPILAQPFLHLDEGEPDAKALEQPVVRVSVAIR
jgi:hypothetical protein